MSRTVTSDLTVTINVLDVDTTHTTAAGGDTIQVAETSTVNYGASPYKTVAKSWSDDLTLAAAPTTLDLTALLSARGVSESFASIRKILFRVTDTATGHTVKVGGGGTNSWFAPLDAITDVYTIPAGSRWVLENNDTTAWAVDGTHKLLKLDPSANTVTVRVVIVGS